MPVEEDDIKANYESQCQSRGQKVGRLRWYWALFEQSAVCDKAGQAKQQCKVCARLLSGNENGSTGLRRHAEAHESEMMLAKKVVDQCQQLAAPNKKRRISSPAGPVTPYVATPKKSATRDTRHSTFQKLLTAFTARNLCPSAIISDSEDFQSFMACVNPGLTIPNKAELRELTKKYMQEMRQTDVIPLLKKMAALSLSLDVWTNDLNGTKYLAVNAHGLTEACFLVKVHLGVIPFQTIQDSAIANEMIKLLDFYQVTQKVVATVRDGGGIMGTCRPALLEKGGIKCGDLDILPYDSKCWAHIIHETAQQVWSQLAHPKGDNLTSAMEATGLKPRLLFKQLRRMATFLVKSIPARKAFKDLCGANQVACRIPPKDAPHRFFTKMSILRWASQYKDILCELFSPDSEINGAKERAASPEAYQFAEIFSQFMKPLTSIAVKCTSSASATKTQNDRYWYSADAVAGVLKVCSNFADEIETFAGENAIDLSSSNAEVLKKFASGKMETKKAGEALKFCAMRIAVDQLRAHLRAPLEELDEGNAHFALTLMLDPRYCDLELVQGYFKKVLKLADDEYSLWLKNLACRARDHMVKVWNKLDPGKDSEKPSKERKSTQDLMMAELGTFATAAAKCHLKHEDSPLPFFRREGLQFPTVLKFARALLCVAGSQEESEDVFSLAIHLQGGRRNRAATCQLSQKLYIKLNKGLSTQLDAQQRLWQVQEAIAMAKGQMNSSTPGQATEQEVKDDRDEADKAMDTFNEQYANLLLPEIDDPENLSEEVPAYMGDSSEDETPGGNQSF